MKYFACIFLIILTTFIGYLFTVKLEKRKVFFNDFYLFNNSLINEVSFNKKTIKELLKNKGNNSVFVNNLYDNYFNEKYEKIEFLSKDDIDFYLEYISFLRKSNLDVEIKFLLDYNAKLEKKRDFYLEKYKKDRVLYIKIGFFVGLLLFVLLI